MVKKIKWCVLLVGLSLGLSSAVLAQGDGSSATISTVPSVQSSLLAEGESAALPAPAPPIHHDTERGEIDLALGFSYLRFRSSQFNANAYGTYTDFTYYISPRIGVEGNVGTGWGGQTSSSAQARSCSFGAGIRVIRPQERWVRPWGHALLGGICMYPQTAFSHVGFEEQLGGGADFRLHYWWLCLRVEGNYVHSHLYTQGQNNLQIATSVVYRF